MIIALMVVVGCRQTEEIKELKCSGGAEEDGNFIFTEYYFTYDGSGEKITRMRFGVYVSSEDSDYLANTEKTHSEFCEEYKNNKDIECNITQEEKAHSLFFRIKGSKAIEEYGYVDNYTKMKKGFEDLGYICE